MDDQLNSSEVSAGTLQAFAECAGRSAASLMRPSKEGRGLGWPTAAVGIAGIGGTLAAGPITSSWKGRAEANMRRRRARRLVAGELAEIAVQLDAVAGMGRMPDIEPDERFLGETQWNRYCETLADDLSDVDWARVWGLYSWLASFRQAASGRARMGQSPTAAGLTAAAEMAKEALELASLLGLPQTLVDDAARRKFQLGETKG